MDFLSVMLVVAVIAMIPVALFFGLVGLALFLYCWKYIGRYLVNFGRWMADWRNLVPCGCMVFMSLILLLVVVPLFLPSALRTLGLVLLVIIMVICGTFAMIVLSFRAMQWFWVGFRRRFWRWMNSLWDLLWRRMPERIERSMPGAPAPGTKPPATRPSLRGRPPVGQQAPRKRSGLGAFWALMLGKPTKPTRVESVPGSAPEPGTQPPKQRAPVKRSVLGNFWALMLGKPSKPAKPKSKPKPVTMQTTEQKSGPSDSVAATAKIGTSTSVTETSTVSEAGKKAPPKRSWFGALWSLILGKPSKSGKPKPGPAGARTSEQATRPSETAAAATAKTGATARVDEAATTPERAKKEKPAKRGFFAGIWTSMVRGVTFVVGLVFLGVVWVVQKMREGIEWIRVRLNLD